MKKNKLKINYRINNLRNRSLFYQCSNREKNVVAPRTGQSFNFSNDSRWHACAARGLLNELYQIYRVNWSMALTGVRFVLCDSQIRVVP